MVEGTQPSPLGLIDLSDSMRGTLKPVLLIRLIMLLQEHAPENFKAAFDEFDPERSKVWRRWAIIHIQDLGQRLQRDRSVASHWDALCREFPVSTSIQHM